MKRYIFFVVTCGLLLAPCALAQDVGAPTPIEMTAPEIVSAPVPVVAAPLPTSGWLMKRSFFRPFVWKARPVMITTAPVVIVKPVRPVSVWAPTIIWK